MKVVRGHLTCLLRETLVRVDDLDAVIQMRLYTDHTYSEAYRSAPSIELRSKVRPGGRAVPIRTFPL